MSFKVGLIETFSWLPASILFKFSTVCKTSNRLLSESFFITKQCKNMKHVPDTDFFIQPNHVQWSTSYLLELHTISPDTNPLAMPQESIEFLARQGPIIASSNGLVCSRNMQSKDKPLFLFNPVTKNYLEIPYPCDRFKYNIESFVNVVFDCTTNDDEEGNLTYLLMVLVAPSEFGSHIFSSMIYSPDLRIWRDGGETDLGQRSMNYECSVKDNHVIYLISDNADYMLESSPFYFPYIVAYDIKKSSSKFLSIPKRARKGVFEPSTKLRIFKWGDSNSKSGSICLVTLRSNVFTAWVLHDKGNHSSDAHHYWSGVFKMSVKDLARTSSTGDHEVSGFTVINGCILLFATKDRVYSCDLKHGNSGESREVCGHSCGDWVQLRSFSSTLRPCGSGAITLPLP